MHWDYIAFMHPVLVYLTSLWSIIHHNNLSYWDRTKYRYMMTL